MNRRRFIQSVAAVLSFPALPSLSFPSANAAVPIAATVPAQARSWAIYMSTLHGECTPQTLQNLLKIPAADARSYVAQLITEGAIKPTPLMQRTMSELVKTKKDGLLDSFKERLEMKELARLDDRQPLLDEKVLKVGEQRRREQPEGVTEADITELQTSDETGPEQVGSLSSENLDNQETGSGSPLKRG